MAYTTESSITGLVNSGSTSERFDVKYDFDKALVVHKKDIKPSKNNDFTAQYICVVTFPIGNSSFIFDTAANRDSFYNSFV